MGLEAMKSLPLWLHMTAFGYLHIIYIHLRTPSHAFQVRIKCFDIPDNVVCMSRHVFKTEAEAAQRL